VGTPGFTADTVGVTAGLKAGKRKFSGRFG